jgi:hypothetical protein
LIFFSGKYFADSTGGILPAIFVFLSQAFSTCTTDFSSLNNAEDMGLKHNAVHLRRLHAKGFKNP